MSYEAPDVVATVYRHFFRALQWPAGVWVALWFGNVFRRCTPDFPEPFRLEPAMPRRAVNIAILSAVMFFCLGMTAVLAAVSGTLLPAPGADVLPWRKDRWNLFLYAFVCPAYVLLCIRLLILALERPAGAPSGPPATPVTVRLFASVFLIVLFSSVLITNYISDASDPTVIATRYWFFDDRNGVRVLNAAGLYYIVLNFSLLVLTFVGGASFISISIDGMSMARTLADPSRDVDFEQFKQRIDRLVRAYRYGVGLVFCYALNLIIWKFSPLGQTANIQIAGALFTAIGLFFVAIPRRFVQHVWADYCSRRASLASGGRNDEPYRDILSNKDNLLLGVLQVVCIGGWFDTFYEVSLDPAHYIGLFFGSG